MKKHRIILQLLAGLCLLLAASEASAQKYPERSEVRKGNRLYYNGDYAGAAERYGRAAAMAPGGFEPAYNLGNALYKTEQYDKAAEVMLRAAADSLRADNERAEAFYNLGNAMFQQKKYKEALQSYAQSLRLNPADMETKFNYAYAKKMLEQQNNGGGGNDEKQDQNKDQNKDQQDQNKDQQDQNKDQQDKGDQGDKGDQQEQEAQPQPQDGISKQEQEQMLDAIQAQEDKTQEKLKEKKGVIVRGKKNW